MSQISDFYTQQAEACGEAAGAATLDNERDKYLKAQAAWQALADGSAMTKAIADKREADRLAN